MADVTIGDIRTATPANPLDGTELLEIEQAGVSKGATADQVKTFALTNANFPTMPTVGGDDIVSSGSNADGAFTRFADGTQICTRANIGLPNLNSKSCEATWTFPAAFINSDVIVDFKFLVLTDFTSAQRLDSILFDNKNGAITDLDAVLRVFIEAGSYAGTETIQVAAFAFGRWKL